MRYGHGLLTAAAIGALASGGLASEDIAITNIGGKIVTGVGDHGNYPGEFEFPVRAFEAELSTADFPLPTTEEPGWLGPFDNVGDGFASGSTIGFRITRALRAWDDAGDTFVSTSETMTLFDSGAGSNIVTTPATDVPVEGFSVVFNADVHAQGGFDEHPFYRLDSLNEGVYLLALELTTSDTSIADSDEIFLLFNWNRPGAELDRALDHVQTVIVPAPGAAGLLAIAGLLGVRRRR